MHALGSVANFCLSSGKKIIHKGRRSPHRFTIAPTESPCDNCNAEKSLGITRIGFHDGTAMVTGAQIERIVKVLVVR